MNRTHSNLPVLLAIIALFSCAAVSFAADPQPRTVSTTGEATVYVVPDQVIVNFGIQTINANLDEATSANKKAAATLVAAIKALGVAEKDIQTDNLDVAIRYNNRDVEIEGYVATRSYAIKLRDTKLFEKLVDTALKNGANQMRGVDFQTTELRKFRDQARQMAIKAAKEKATDLAKELDCTIGKPRTISESGSGYYFGGGNFGNRWGNSSQNAIQEMPAGADASDTLPLGQIAVRASVSVTFDMPD